VSEEALHDLARARGKGELWRELQRRRSERPEFAAAVELLEGLLADAGRKTPFDLLARLCERQDRAGRSMRTRLRTRLGPEAEDALDETLAQVLALERQGVRDLEGVAHALAQLAVTVKREMDEARGEVRVMTAHGAKGLEAPIVFVPETVSREQTREPLLPLEDGGFLWCLRSASDCEASRAARLARARREEHEGYRLLYVALTRARDRVVLAGRAEARAREENLKGWWRAVNDALASLDGQVRRCEGAGVKFGRFGPDPRRSDEKAVEAAQAAAAEPAWLRTLVPFQPAPKIASPSQALDEAPDLGNAISPIARTSGLGRFRRGEIIHRLLQLLPDIPAPERRGACAALLAQEPLLTVEQREEMTAAAFGVIDDPVFAPVFGPGSRAEASLAGASERLPASLQISGRVDRLVVGQDRVLVVDYKTNRPAPQSIEEADPAYVTQMAIYVAVLSEIFPGRRVEAALVWTDGPKLMPVPENLVAQSLAALAPAR
jgi:ATP-dependent helicase/nuclease subunit A